MSTKRYGGTRSESSRRAPRAHEQRSEGEGSPLDPEGATPPEERERQRPPVVGLCASAGGLDAFKRFFAAMPATSGAAYVLIPHLDPKHESLMVELLARYTQMPVVEAEDGMPVEADRVHVIPPNRYMTVRGGVLRLTGPVERRGLQTSMDIFLRSLADDQQERAICIILSGTGAHGSLGLKAVKANGGLAMVQDPGTAEYDRMPVSAIATGLADFVLPVEDMPAALVEYLRHADIGRRTGQEAAETPDRHEEVLALLRARTRLDFSCYRKRMLRRRVERRMALGHLDQVADYLAVLRDRPEEVKQLARDLLISVTSFFRDPQAFNALDSEVIAPLVRAKDPEAPIRIWVPGCATGEEAYSIAILVLEHLSATQKRCRLQIFATDVDLDSLEVGRQGSYPDTISTDVSAERLARFFTRVDEGRYQVDKRVREAVVFAPQNLILDPPFSKLDLVACRNMLIYLEPEVQQKVVALFHFALSQGGCLLLGPSETIGRQLDLFEPLSTKWRIYRRVGPARPDRVEIPITTKAGRSAKPERPAPTGEKRSEGYVVLAQRLLFEELAAAAVLVNHKLEAIWFLGPVVRFLNLPSGEPTRDLLAMAPEGLRAKLRAALHRNVRGGERVVLSRVLIRRNGQSVPVRVTVKPLSKPPTAEAFALVTFQDLIDETPQPEPLDIGEEPLLSQLELELESTREDLQTTVEELESSNEELKTANEEVMSMNEELQSANEELETSKEELQSLNEELTTVNQQLQEKVEELNRANSDVTNLLACTEIATLFLDRDLRICQLTPTATSLLKLIASDVGRPIDTFSSNLTGPDLAEDARRVLDRLSPVERELLASDGRSFLRRILPYRSGEDSIGGVVVTFVDLTERLRQEERLRTSLREKEILLQEVHHRVKNNLQVISSLVSLRADSLSDLAMRRLFEDVRDQVRAMALVHETLYSSRDLSSVDFGRYARSLLNQLWRGHGELAARVQLEPNLEQVLLPVDVAVPCGLMLNELVSNALHHAFPGRPTGRVAVGLECDADGQVNLWVRDDGVGYPPGFEWRKSPTLGLQLVQLLVQQVGGVIEVRADEGTEFRVRFPLPRGAADGEPEGGLEPR